MVELADEQRRLARTAAQSESNPIEFDGLSFGNNGDGYWIETAKRGLRGLSASAFDSTLSDEQIAPYISNWHFWEHTVAHDGRHRRAFLRFLESAAQMDVHDRYAALESGMQTTWGELSITATLASHGVREYQLHHERDAGTSASKLETYENPFDAREIARFDSEGRYRPLQTAPSLIDGWIYPALTQREVFETVDILYPATIPNWNLERTGELDITHWHETAQRQTGIYDMVEELSTEAVDWMAASCCADSECLKRREWEYDENTTLEADGGSGVFPCREPCSLVVAASRQWTQLEKQEPRSYTFELTPAEKEQIEDMIESVAEGNISEIREADVSEGANRYRTRFLREKRMDEEGNLSGTPTHSSEKEDG